MSPPTHPDNRNVRIAGAIFFVVMCAASGAGPIVLSTAPARRLSIDSPTPLALCSAAVLFTLASSGALLVAGHRGAVTKLTLVIFGLSFPIWGMFTGMLLAFVGGIYGIPQAILTAIYLWAITRSGVLAAASVGALGPAWLAAFGLAAAVPGPDRHIFNAMFVWNAIMAAALGIWAVRACARRTFRLFPPGACQTCGYDTQGLPTTTCPECGQAS